MKRLLSLLSFVCLFVLGSYAANARIYAYGLKLTTEGDNYTFKFTANEVPTEAYLVFYSAGTGKEIGTYEIPNANTIAKGVEKTITLSRALLPGGGTMNWGVRLKAGAIESFGLVYADASLTYARAYANVDTHPESDYFGTIYVANRKPTKSESRLYIYDQTCKKSATAYLLGESEWAFGRFAIAENGKLYLSDYSDNHSGCFIVDPSDLTHSTQFFAGTRGGSGLFTYNSTIETGSSLAATHIYGKGKDAKLFAVAEDYTGYTGKFPVAIYNIGNADGTLKESWTTAPNVLYKTLGNGAQNFDIRGCEKGAWVATSRSVNNNTSDATSLRFYDLEGNCKYSSHEHTDIINGSMGGGFTITEDGKTMYLVNGNGNILELSISWSGNTPSLSLVRTYTTTYNAISSINVDYAGNLVVTAGSSFNTSSTTQLGLSVYTMPTDVNTCTVPAKKSLTVYAPLSGTFNIGGDEAIFTSLASAMDTLEHYGIKGDCNFRICADLTETRNIGIANNTDHKITICPDGTTKRTITMNNADDNQGPSGNIMIGCTMATLINTDATAKWISTDTRNIFFDGSFEGDNEQHLEIRGGVNGGVILVFYGNVTNSEVRNCRLISTRTTNTAYAVHIRTQKDSDRKPVGIGLMNCYIQVTGASNAQAIYFNGSQSSTAAGKPKDCYLRGCEIVSNLRGVFFNGAIDPIIENNTFRINGGTGFQANGILGSSQSGTITIRGNKFTELATSQNVTEKTYGHGIRGITAEGGSTTWIIENNYFGGLNAKASAAAGKDFGMMYVRCGNYCTCQLRHNTFYMPSLSNKPAPELLSTTPISCVFIANGTPTIENNLFVSAETTTTNSLIRGTLNSNVKNNVFYHAGGNAYVVDGTASAQAFNNLASSYQSTNKWQQVAFETGSYRITDEYANNINLGVDHLDGFNYDIEGNTRNTPTRAGCYDPAWEITLDQTANNDALLTDFDNILVDATLNRSFADDGWYTLVLPFDANAEQLTEAFGAGYQVAELQESYWKNEEHTDMYLRFNMQSNIHAGVPCLFKMGEGKSCSSVNFSDVTIDKSVNDVETELMDMKGMYKPTEVDYLNNNYYLGTEDLLYPYTSTFTTNGFRAYFHLNFDMSGMQAPVRARVIFHDQVATDIEDLPEPAAAPAAQKVLRDGQLIIIRDGKEYNVQGELVR